jgi:hypothetical protein
MYKRVAASFCLMSIISVSLFSQAKQNPFVIEAQYNIGKVLSVHSNFPQRSLSNNVELFLGYQTYGKEKWNKLFNYPRMGVSLIFQELGNNKVLGRMISVVPTAYFPLIKKENSKLNVDIRYGLGLACFTNPYDPIKNKDNKGAGARFAWQFEIGSNLRWNITKQVSLQAGFVIYHASNAHTQLPNVGVNNIAGSVGILVHPFNPPKRSYAQDTAKVDKHWHFNVRFGSGWHEKGSAFGPVGGKKYPVYTAALYTSKLVGKKIYVKLGMIYRYYPLYRSFIEDHNSFSTNLGLKSSAFILFSGFEFQLGHFAINLEAGVNLYKPSYKPFLAVYEKSSAFNNITKEYIATRFGLNYYILNPYKYFHHNVFIGAAVCANFGQAEFLELNIGYRY